MVGLAAASGCLVYYLDQDSESRMLWLIGSGTIICIWPWTLLAMKPDINKLLKDDIQETAGDVLFCQKLAADEVLHLCCNLTLKAPITTAADDNFHNIFPNFQKQ